MTDFRFRAPLSVLAPADRYATELGERLPPAPTIPVLHETPFGWHAQADRSELDASLELAPRAGTYEPGHAARVDTQPRNTNALREAYAALAFLAWIWQLRAAAKALKEIPK